MRLLPLLTTLALLLPAAALAGDTEGEIEYLITTIGESGCSYIRNGSDAVPSGEWLSARLQEYRAQASNSR